MPIDGDVMFNATKFLGLTAGMVMAVAAATPALALDQIRPFGPSALDQIRPFNPSLDQIRPFKPQLDQIRPFRPSLDQIRPFRPV